MSRDLASMSITQETEDEVMALFARLEQLLPGMVTLPVGERKGLPLMGPKSERYVRSSIDLGNRNAGLIPLDVDLPGANRDLDARDRMLRITSRATQFSDRCSDTTAALGSDLMVAAHVIYAILKVVGKSAGLDEAVKELGYRFARPKKKPATANEE